LKIKWGVSWVTKKKGENGFFFDMKTLRLGTVGSNGVTVLTAKTGGFGGISVPVLLFPQNISHEVACDRTEPFEVE
jgi:hypothetical protein